MASDNDFVEAVTFNEEGLVPVIVQDAVSREVLMLAYMTEATLRETLETGQMVYWSRSRGERWVKGATSGHTQEVEEARVDCDGDTLLFKVHQTGGACHTGYRSCFYRRRADGQLIEDGEQVFDPEEVYGDS